jgi:uncharacterized membrane protein
MNPRIRPALKLAQSVLLNLLFVSFGILLAQRYEWSYLLTMAACLILGNLLVAIFSRQHGLYREHRTDHANKQDLTASP